MHCTPVVTSAGILGLKCVDTPEQGPIDTPEKVMIDMLGFAPTDKPDRASTEMLDLGLFDKLG